MVRIQQEQMNQSCANCYFARAKSIDPGKPQGPIEAYCRRYPPPFPHTSLWSWCGEWKRKFPNTRDDIKR